MTRDELNQKLRELGCYVFEDSIWIPASATIPPEIREKLRSGCEIPVPAVSPNLFEPLQKPEIFESSAIRIEHPVD